MPFSTDDPHAQELLARNSSFDAPQTISRDNLSLPAGFPQQVSPTPPPIQQQAQQPGGIRKFFASVLAGMGDAALKQSTGMNFEEQRQSEAMTQYYRAHAADMQSQVQARNMALEPVNVPPHIAQEFGLDPSQKISAGQLHEYGTVYHQTRMTGKTEDPEQAFTRRLNQGQQMGLNQDELKTYALTGTLPKPSDHPDTAAELESKYINWVARKKQNLPTSPAEDAYGAGYEKNKMLVPNANAAGRGDARSDRSYQFNSGQLEKLAAPIEDRIGRLTRLEDTVNQATPQADSLVAPELLTVMAGGQGSGLRMNEAEIARVIGGRTNWESIKAAVNKWQLDPSKGLSINPAQRGQIRSLLGIVRDKMTAKQAIIDDARQQMIGTDDVATHRKIVTKAHQQLDAIDSGSLGSAGSAYPDAIRQKVGNFDWGAVPGAVPVGPR